MQLEALPIIQSVALHFSHSEAVSGPHLSESTFIWFRNHFGGQPLELVPIGVSENIIAILIGLLRDHDLTVDVGDGSVFPAHGQALVLLRSDQAPPLNSGQVSHVLNRASSVREAALGGRSSLPPFY